MKFRSLTSFQFLLVIWKIFTPAVQVWSWPAPAPLHFSRARPGDKTTVKQLLLSSSHLIWRESNPSHWTVVKDSTIYCTAKARAEVYIQTTWGENSFPILTTKKPALTRRIYTTETRVKKSCHVLAPRLPSSPIAPHVVGIPVLRVDVFHENRSVAFELGGHVLLHVNNFMPYVTAIAHHFYFYHLDLMR